MSDDRSAPVGEFERLRVLDSALLGFKSFVGMWLASIVPVPN